MRLTISNGGLTGSEFVSGFYFNFDPTKNAAAYLGSLPGTGTQSANDIAGAGNDVWHADGDGYFDFFVDFPTAAASRFTAGETFIWEWNGLGLTVADFNYTSVNGPPGKTGFYAAAQVQGIGTGGQLSGWIADGDGPGDTPQVPEPMSLALIGIALAGLSAVRRRKQ